MTLSGSGSDESIGVSAVDISDIFKSGESKKVLGHVLKKFHSKVRFNSSLRSSANVHTSIKLLFRTCIKNYYFDTSYPKFDFAHALIKTCALN